MNNNSDLVRIAFVLVEWLFYKINKLIIWKNVNLVAFQFPAYINQQSHGSKNYLKMHKLIEIKASPSVCIAGEFLTEKIK